MKKFRGDIQGIRAIAVLAVLLFHMNINWLPGGFVGVDVFFVISGFLITGIILRKKEHQAFNFLDFYKSRVKRIVPAYYAMLAIAAAVGMFMFIKSDANRLFSGLRYCFVFLSNQYFPDLNTYFGTSMSENPLLHTWTLAIEMQFYFILPLILLLFKRKQAFIVLLSLTLVLLTYTQYKIHTGAQSKMYFSLPARMPEFFVGCMLAFGYIRLKKTGILSLIGIGLILASYFLINEHTAFPGLISMIPVTGCSLLILCQDSAFNKKLLSSKPMVYIGEISYSVYLWHWPVLAFLRYHYQEYDLPTGILLLSVVVIWGIAHASFRYIEVYFREPKKGSVKKLSILTLTAVLLMLLVKPVNNWRYTYPESFTNANALGLNNHAEFYQGVIRGDKNATDTVLIIGDSHGMVLTKYLDTLGIRNHFAVRAITNDSYPPIPGIGVPIEKATTYKNLVKEFEKYRTSRVIFFAKRWDYNIQGFKEAFETFVKKLDTTQRLIVFKGFPVLDKNPVRTFKGIKNTGKIITHSGPAIYPELITFMDAHPNVQVFDFPDTGVFRKVPFYHDTLMYYDATHMNAYGVGKIAIETEQQLMKVLDSALRR